MDSEGHHQDDPMIVTIVEGLTDCDSVWDERNTLAVALRKIIAGDGAPPHLWGIDDARDVAETALDEVFPEDPLGEKAIYDCPSADGTNRLRDEIEGGRP